MSTNHNKDNNENKQPIVVNIIQPDADRTDAIEANKISRRSVKVNRGLLVFTIVLAAISLGQYMSSQTAATIAQKTLNLQIKAQKSADSVQKVATRKADSLDSVKTKRDNEVFKLQRDGLSAQITSLKETQKQFKIVNEPYLQIFNPVLDTFAVGKRIAISYILRNLGAYPVQIIHSKTSISTRKTDPGINNPVLRGTINMNLLNDYIVKETPVGFLEQDPRILDIPRYTEVMNGRFFVWFSGVFEYKNLITKQKKVYRFIIKIKPNAVGDFTSNRNSRK